jgi:1-pyrroline-5-carboxylate dehydrogenase
MSRPAIFRPPPPHNEPVLGYEPGSPERSEVQSRLAEMAAEPIEIPVVIGGEEIRTGDTFDAVMPHDKQHVLAHVHKAGAAEVDRAIAASAEAWESGPQSSFARPSCSRGRGARRSWPRRC